MKTFLKSLIERIGLVGHAIFYAQERTFCSNFFAFFLWSFGITLTIYYSLSLFLRSQGQSYPLLSFIPWTGGHYQYDYPYQYIALVCLFYSLFAAKLAPRIAKTTMLQSLVLSIVVVLAAPITASPFGGMLIHFHDMLAGFFSTTEEIVVKLLGGAIEGVVGSLFLFIGLSLHTHVCRGRGNRHHMAFQKTVFTGKGLRLCP